MSVTPERLALLKQSAAALPAQFEPEPRPPFCDLTALRVAREASPGIDGSALSDAIKRIKAHHQKTGQYQSAQCGTAAQRIVRQHMGKMQNQRREMSKELRAAGYQARYASADEVLNMMATAHDRALEEARPSGRAILRQQVGEKDAPRLATRQSRHLKTALRALEKHPTAQLMQAQGVRTARDLANISSTSLAGSVAALYQRADIAARLSKQDAEMVSLRARIDAAEAKLAAHDRRLDAVEAGSDWKAAAIQLKVEGLNAGDIARRLGRPYDTVRKHLQRHG
jgi:hypothetical protein